MHLHAVQVLLQLDAQVIQHGLVVQHCGGDVRRLHVASPAGQFVLVDWLQVLDRLVCHVQRVRVLGEPLLILRGVRHLLLLLLDLFSAGVGGVLQA